MVDENKIALFDGKKVRKVWHNKEWWFSVVDIVSWNKALNCTQFVYS